MYFNVFPIVCFALAVCSLCAWHTALKHSHTYTHVESRTHAQCDKFVNVHVALSMLRCMYMCHKMRTGHATKPMATTNDSMVRWARLCVLYTSHTHHCILDWWKFSSDSYCFEILQRSPVHLRFPSESVRMREQFWNKVLDFRSIFPTAPTIEVKESEYI